MTHNLIQASLFSGGYILTLGVVDGARGHGLAKAIRTLSLSFSAFLVMAVMAVCR